MEMQLVLPAAEHRERYQAMMEEWLGYGGRLHPGALRSGGAPYEKWLRWVEEDRHPETCPPGSPPQTLYFFMEGEALVGAVSLRHCLNDRTRIDGGHLGIGIRPGQRRQGKATRALGLALEKLREMGIEAVLLTCAEGNAGSERTMLKWGAVYQDTVVNGAGERTKRFWIHPAPNETCRGEQPREEVR